MKWLKKILVFLGIVENTRDLYFEDGGRTYFVSVHVDAEERKVRLVGFEVWEAGHEGILQLEASSMDFDKVKAFVKSYHETTFSK